MGFYLRKAFSKGPLRLNLSKGGIGLSSGIKGLRLGVNSRGTPYIHAGREGFYYRKNLKTNSKSGPTLGGMKTNYLPNGEVELFEDTGLTFPCFSKKGKTSTEYLPPSIAFPSLVYKMIKWSGITFLILAFFYHTTAILALFALFLHYYLKRQEKQISTAVESFESFANTEGIGEKEIIDKVREIAALSPFKNSKNGILAHCFEVLLIREIETKNYNSKLVSLFQNLGLEKKDADYCRLMIFEKYLDILLEDHILSEQEEKNIEELHKSWKIDVISTEEFREYYKFIQDFSKEHRQEVKPISKENERLFFKGEARFLKSFVLDRFQVNKVIYKRKAYKLDLEGVFTVSTTHFGIEHRTYKVDQIKDVTLSLEDGVLEIDYYNRKSNLLISCKELMKLYMALEHVVSKNSLQGIS